MNKHSHTITILGAPNDAQGDLSVQSLDRISKALAVLDECSPGTGRLILTGGFGGHFNATEYPHTHYVRAALMARGVPPDVIVAELPSTNTYEDVSMLHAYLKESGLTDGKHCVVTSNFHAERVELLIRRTFLDFPAPTVERAVDTLVPDELRKLEAHEQNAIAKLQPCSITP